MRPASIGVIDLPRSPAHGPRRLEERQPLAAAHENDGRVEAILEVDGEAVVPQDGGSAHDGGSIVEYSGELAHVAQPGDGADSEAAGGVL